MTSTNKTYPIHYILSGLTSLSIISYFVTYYADAHIASLVGSYAFGGIKIKLRVLHNLVHVLLLGQDGVLLRYMSTYAHHEDDTLLAGFSRWIMRSVITRCIFIIVCCLCAMLWGYMYYDDVALDWGAWLLFIVPIIMICFFDRYFLYLKKYYLSFTPRALLQPILLLMILYAIPNISSHAILMAYGGTYALVAGALMLYFLFIRPPMHTSAPTMHAKWWANAWFYWSSMIIIQTSRSLNLFLLDWLGNDGREVGYYSAILTITLGLYVFTKSLENYVKPWISRYYKEPKMIIPILCECNIMRYVLVITLCIIILIAAPWIMGTFGDEFIPYAHALRALMFMYSIYTLGQPNFDLLNFSGHTHISSGIMVFKLILMLLLAIILIPSMGLWGCLWADGLTSMLAVVLASLYCINHLGFHGWVLLYHEKKTYVGKQYLRCDHPD